MPALQGPLRSDLEGLQTPPARGKGKAGRRLMFPSRAGRGFISYACVCGKPGSWLAAGRMPSLRAADAYFVVLAVVLYAARESGFSLELEAWSGFISPPRKTHATKVVEAGTLFN